MFLFYTYYFWLVFLVKLNLLKNKLRITEKIIKSFLKIELKKTEKKTMLVEVINGPKNSIQLMNEDFEEVNEW